MKSCAGTRARCAAGIKGYIAYKVDRLCQLKEPFDIHEGETLNAANALELAGDSRTECGKTLTGWVTTTGSHSGISVVELILNLCAKSM